MKLTFGLVGGAAVVIGGMVLAAQQGTGAYTASQAANGKAIYDRHCAECHLPDLKGSAGPELAIVNFIVLEVCTFPKSSNLVDTLIAGVHLPRLAAL